MLTLSFKLSPDQDHDDAINFNLIVEDCDAATANKIEFEFIGDNLVLAPQKLALKDIYNPAVRGVVYPIKATLVASGDASATMKSTINGNPIGTVQYSFDI